MNITKTSLSLDFIIVGAGLGGLAAAIGLKLSGHHVVVLEQAPQLGEVGAGIQVPPNSTKILAELGVSKQLEDRALKPVDFKIFRYDDGTLLSQQNLIPHTQNVYQGDYLHVHRADFHRVLVDRAVAIGVEIHLGCHVMDVDYDLNQVNCSNGEIYTGDVIIGADGLKSKVRSSMLGRDDPPHDTGDLAYRALITVDEAKKFPEQLKFIYEQPNINFWWGPNCHIVVYLLQGGKMINVVVLSPDNLPENVNIVPAEEGELLALFKDWDPRLLKLFELVHETSKWRLQNSMEMESWVHETANVALLGDSCHATLPYLAQGAAQAVEDAAVLWELFGHIESRDQIHGLLETYEGLRKWRTTQVVHGSTNCRNIYHLADGTRQMERDALLAAVPPTIGCPNRFADPVFQKFMFGYDAFSEAKRGWEAFKRGEKADFYVENLYKLWT